MKKFFIALAAVFVLFINLNAQNYDEFYSMDTGSLYFVNSKGDTAIKYYYSYPVFSEQNPAINGAALNSYLHNSGLLEFEQKFEEYKKLYSESNMEEMDWGNIWEESVTISVLSITPEMVSLSSSYYNYLGGAHGMYGTTGMQLNPATGIPYSNSELLSYESEVYEGLRNLAAQKLLEKYGTGSETETFSDLGFWFENDEFILSENFIITEEGFVFLYQPYEIAPYALGLIEIPLKFEEITPYLNPDCPMLTIK